MERNDGKNNNLPMESIVIENISGNTSHKKVTHIGYTPNPNKAALTEEETNSLILEIRGSGKKLSHNVIKGRKGKRGWQF
jgi:hypothetical protein